MALSSTWRHRHRPIHPGALLQRDYLLTHGLTIATLAKAIGVSRQSINELLRGRRAVSPEMALRFARLFGTTAEYWLNAQAAVDLWDAARILRGTIARITPLHVARVRDTPQVSAGTTGRRAPSDEKGT